MTWADAGGNLSRAITGYGRIPGDTLPPDIELKVGMVAEILDAVCDGYLARDLARAEGGLKRFADALLTPASWIAEAVSDEGPVGLVEDWRRWAAASDAVRRQAAERIVAGLKSLPADDFDDPAKLAAHFRKIIVKDFSPKPPRWPLGLFADAEAEACLRPAARTYRLATPAVPCADEVALDELPLKEIVDLLSLPDGDAEGLFAALASMAERLQDDSTASRTNNWAAAMAVHGHILSHPILAGGDALSRAAAGMRKILGSPEEINPFAAKLLPPVWDAGDLPQWQRGGVAEDAISLGVSIAMLAGPVIGGFKFIRGALASGAKKAVGSTPALGRFAALMADPRGAPTALGHTLGPKSAAVARALGRTGQALHDGWDLTFGALGRTVLPPIGLIGRSLAREALSLKVVGPPLSATAGAVGSAYLFTRGLEINWRGAVVVWWGMREAGLIQAAGSTIPHRIGTSDPLASGIEAFLSPGMLR